jgi:outer membrane lipoprotein LolB
MKNPSFMLVALMLLGLVGCSSLPTTPAPAPAVEPDAQALAAEAERVRQVQSQLDWGFAGRVAVGNGRDGGSGRLDWQQGGSGFQARLSAPVTRQGWELSMDFASGQARLDGLAGGPRQGDDARALVQQSTGWDLPVATLGDWVRGVLDGQAQVQARDVEGRPLRAEQDGWQVQFGQWYEAEPGRPALPRRIDAVNGQARVRLLVDQWMGWEQ